MLQNSFKTANTNAQRMNIIILMSDIMGVEQGGEFRALDRKITCTRVNQC